MKKNARHMVLFCLVMLCFVFQCKMIGKAAFLGEKVYVKGTGTVMDQDITGDGEKDTIRVDISMLDAYYCETLKVYVNGNLALTENIKGCSGADACFFSCSKSNNYLQIHVYADGGYMYLNKIYAYADGKLVTAADFGREDNMMVFITKVTSSAITVKFSVQPAETGRVEWNYVYQPNGKKLKLKNATAKATSTLGSWTVNDGYQKYFKQNKFVTNKGRTFYTSSSMKKKAFTTQRGDILKLQSVKWVGKKMYMSFKKGNKVGWQIVNKHNSTSRDWFYGVGSRLAG